MRPPTHLLAAVAVVLAGGLATGLALTGSDTPVAAAPSVVQQVATVPAPVERAAVSTAPQASRSRAVPPVMPLKAVLTPDVRVVLPGALSSTQLAALKRIKGLRGFTSTLTGSVTIGKTRLRVSGVEPGTFRSFTPKATARSDALWASIARGDLGVSYGVGLKLGTTYAVAGRPLRAGALASYGLPSTDLVVDRAVAKGLGLRQTAIVVAAPDRSITRLRRDLTRALGESADLTTLRVEKVRYRRPATYNALYQLSASYCPGLSWKVLAAIGQIESGHGRNLGPSSAGALGPMQFMPATWAAYAVDGDGDGKADIMSPFDAVPAASLYLCRNGAGRGGESLYNAIFNYNHADWYVRKVLALAARY